MTYIVSFQTVLSLLLLLLLLPYSLPFSFACYQPLLVMRQIRASDTHLQTAEAPWPEKTLFLEPRRGRIAPRTVLHCTPVLPTY
jgi:hypothetical protein